jgi:hypothetical protein
VFDRQRQIKTAIAHYYKADCASIGIILGIILGCSFGSSAINPTEIVITKVPAFRFSLIKAVHQSHHLAHYPQRHDI